MWSLLDILDASALDAGNAEDGHNVLLEAVVGRRDDVILAAHHQGNLRTSENLFILALFIME